MKSDLVDLMLTKHHQTDKDVLVSYTGEEAKAVWLPLSRVEIEEARSIAKGKLKGGQTVTLQIIIVTMPERLAMEKGVMQPASSVGPRHAVVGGVAMVRRALTRCGTSRAWSSNRSGVAPITWLHIHAVVPRRVTHLERRCAAAGRAVQKADAQRMGDKVGRRVQSGRR
jgi:hypothetical protein